MHKPIKKHNAYDTNKETEKKFRPSKGAHTFRNDSAGAQHCNKHSTFQL